MKKLISTLLMTLSFSAFANGNNVLDSSPVTDRTPGWINAGADYTNDAGNGVAVRITIVNNNNAQLVYGCVWPNTGFSQGLSRGAIGVDNSSIKVEAALCEFVNGKWQAPTDNSKYKTLGGNFNYSSANYYNIAVNLGNNSYRLAE